MRVTRLEKAAGRFADGSVDGKRLAEDLGVAHGTIKRWLSEGMPCRRINKRVHVYPDEARAWVAERYPRTIARDRRSVVYFAASADGRIKIGWTSDVMRRVQEVRRDARCAVELLACIPGTKPDELALHERFAADRISSDDEWFRPSDELLGFIASLGRSAA